jgi:hypothetical protein
MCERLSVGLFVVLSLLGCLSVCHIYLSVYLFVCLSICRSACLCVCVRGVRSPPTACRVLHAALDGTYSVVAPTPSLCTHPSSPPSQSSNGEPALFTAEENAELADLLCMEVFSALLTCVTSSTRCLADVVLQRMCSLVSAREVYLLCMEAFAVEPVTSSQDGFAPCALQRHTSILRVLTPGSLHSRVGCGGNMSAYCVCVCCHALSASPQAHILFPLFRIVFTRFSLA